MTRRRDAKFEVEGDKHVRGWLFVPDHRNFGASDGAVRHDVDHGGRSSIGVGPYRSRNIDPRSTPRASRGHEDAPARWPAIGLVCSGAEDLATSRSVLESRPSCH